MAPPVWEWAGAAVVVGARAAGAPLEVDLTVADVRRVVGVVVLRRTAGRRVVGGAAVVVDTGFDNGSSASARRGAARTFCDENAPAMLEPLLAATRRVGLAGGRDRATMGTTTIARHRPS